MKNLKGIKGYFIFAIVTFLFILISSILINLAFENMYDYPSSIKYGVTFSPEYVSFLNLDWKSTYLSILDDLKVKNLRLPAYWEVMQPKIDLYDFSETDFMLTNAQKRGVSVILVLGAKQPRYPECHIPNWAKNLSLNQRQQKTLDFIQKVVDKYKDNSAISAWQIENEPFLKGFGEGCDPIDIDFLKSEIELVKKLDHRPIMLTDSGELGVWIDTMKLADIFGTSVYRSSYNQVLGYFSYPTLPVFYDLKLHLVRLFYPNHKQIIVSELQAEPWIATADLRSDADKQGLAFPLSRLISNINFAKKTGFDTDYLWGVEWWYWMNAHNHPEYLDYARTIFK